MAHLKKNSGGHLLKHANGHIKKTPDPIFVTLPSGLTGDFEEHSDMTYELHLYGSCRWKREFSPSGKIKVFDTRDGDLMCTLYAHNFYCVLYWQSVESEPFCTVCGEYPYDTCGDINCFNYGCGQDDPIGSITISDS